MRIILNKKYEFIQKVNKLGHSLTADPITFKKAVLLCLYAEGIRFAAGYLFSRLGMYYGLLPDFLYLFTVLVIASQLGKGELGRIFVWRDIPIAIFASVLIMFFGFNVIRSELGNLFQFILPVPDGFFDGWFY